MLTPSKKCNDQLRQHIKKQRYYFVNKGPSSQSYGFSSNHVWMWEFDPKESWALKNWSFELWRWRKLLRIPWTARRSNPSILKEISPGCSLEELMWKLKHPFLVMNISSFFDVKSWLIQNTLMLGKIEGRSRRGQQRRRQFGPEFGWILGVGDGQGGLAWCSPWGCKELYMTDQLNWTAEVWKRKGKCCVFTYLWTLVNKTNEQMQWNRLKSTMNSGWEGLRRYVK